MLSQRSKKGKFSYKPIVSNSSKKIVKTCDISFPDDFNAYSQSSKKQKIDNEKKENIPFKTSDFLSNEDLMDDDFDFTQAANEIDQIEIAASQRITTKNKTKKLPPEIGDDLEEMDILDQLLSGSKSNVEKKPPANTFSLKLPKKVQNTQTSCANGSSVKLDLKKQQQHVEKRKYDCLQDMPGSSNSNSLAYQSSQREKEIKLKKEKENLELLNSYKVKIEAAEKKYISKDGEISMLREKLQTFTETEKEHKNKILQLEQDLKTQRSEKEEQLQAKVERLETQLTFKEKEVRDVLEKQQKKNSFIAGTPKVKPKSPKVTLYSDGFEKGIKTESSTSLSGPTTRNIKDKKDIFLQCKLQKQMYKKQKLQIVPEYLNKQVKYEKFVLQHGRLKCKHTNQDSKQNSCGEFLEKYQSTIEIVDQDNFFIPEFIMIINNYLNSMVELFSEKDAKDTKEKSEIPERNCSSPTRNCQLCQDELNNGLFCLKQLCVVSTKVKEYLLIGLVNYLGKEKDLEQVQIKGLTVNGKTFNAKYPILTSSLMVEKGDCLVLKENPAGYHDYKPAVKFWSAVTKLVLIEDIDEVVTILFNFHSSLIPYNVNKYCEEHCQYMINHKLLQKYMKSFSVDRLLDMIQMLEKLVSVKYIYNLVCTQADDCPLLRIYNWFFDGQFEGNSKVLISFQKLVCLQSSLISCNPREALTCFVKSECRCAGEIIEFLVIFLYDEFKYFQKELFLSVQGSIKLNKLRLTCFRQGMSLLYLICCAENNLGEKVSAVESTYIHLLAGTVKLFRKIPSISNKEVVDLEELLEMDQHIDVPDEMMNCDSINTDHKVVVID